MLALTIRTDKPEAELSLIDSGQQLSAIKWQAHRELSDTIHLKIKELLNKSGKKMEELEGLVIYKGPGSFTGLRIGFAVANTMAYALNIPIVAADGKDWAKTGCKKMAAGQNDKIALPEYGSPPHITKPKK